jgi:hypothetical protein
MRLMALAHRLDPGRPVTYAENHLYRARREHTTGLVDVWSANYELDQLEEGRDASLQHAVVVSECSNYPLAERGSRDEELAQVRLIERDLERMAGRPYVAGFLVWCWNDYSTLRKDRFRRFSGVVDAWRVPKMAHHYLRARFSETPFVSVSGDWGTQSAGTAPEAGGGDASAAAAVGEVGDDMRQVYIFTNCRFVDVLIGGVPHVELAGRPCIVRAVPFEDGDLLVRGRNDEEVLCEERLLSYGTAEGIDLRSTRAHLLPGETGVVSIDVRVVDGRRRRVDTWNGTVTLAVEGGRVKTHLSGGMIRVSRGTGRGLIIPLEGVREMTVTACAEGLADGVCRIDRKE